jgi:hypothetical protein
LKKGVAFTTEPSPPRRVAGAVRLEQAVEYVVLVEQRELEQRGHCTCEDALPTGRQTGHDNEPSVHRVHFPDLIKCLPSLTLFSSLARRADRPRAFGVCKRVLGRLFADRGQSERTNRDVVPVRIPE